MSTARPFKTDVSVKTSLNAGLLPGAGGSSRTGGRGGGGAAGQTGGGAEREVSSEEYLDRFEEELHRKVDAEMEILVDGLGDCVRLSKVGVAFVPAAVCDTLIHADMSLVEQVGNKDKFKAAQDALEVELKAESMVGILPSFRPAHSRFIPKKRVLPVLDILLPPHNPSGPSYGIAPLPQSHPQDALPLE